MASSTPARDCEQCGAEMEVIDSWSGKSPPLIGTTVEQAEYECPECGNRSLYRRKGEEDWQAA